MVNYQVFILNDGVQCCEEDFQNYFVDCITDNYGKRSFYSDIEIVDTYFKTLCFFNDKEFNENTPSSMDVDMSTEMNKLIEKNVYIWTEELQKQHEEVVN